MKYELQALINVAVGAAVVIVSGLVLAFVTGVFLGLVRRAYDLVI